MTWRKNVLVTLAGVTAIALLSLWGRETGGHAPSN